MAQRAILLEHLLSAPTSGPARKSAMAATNTSEDSSPNATIDAHAVSTTGIASNTGNSKKTRFTDSATRADILNRTPASDPRRVLSQPVKPPSAAPSLTQAHQSVLDYWSTRSDQDFQPGGKK